MWILESFEHINGKPVYVSHVDLKGKVELGFTSIKADAFSWKEEDDAYRIENWIFNTFEVDVRTTEMANQSLRAKHAVQRKRKK